MLRTGCKAACRSAVRPLVSSVVLQITQARGVAFLSFTPNLRKGRRAREKDGRTGLEGVVFRVQVKMLGFFKRKKRKS
ncbi:hypothetical protein CONLIGDRAFT_335417 [Coniochaeta ligniaria NRRL 30616]|uniref:Uncharacterized protein n=1 Tax=Coniochaeta ligniaria NRRL 30616 TaxID=1408157 RepID=A0A1J7IPS9_9PEZI|nr:hypothetical protein CONLIGDRAFT_335417 [Coniochaeta ligniaria NRRL 30616]